MPPKTLEAHESRLANAVAASCGGDRPELLAAALAASALEPVSYEASVRGGPGRALSAGRMMIERAPVPVLDAVAAALDVALPPVVARWVELARQAQVPLIVGWDLRQGSDRRCVKVYVNASDVADAVRTRLRAVLLPRVRHQQAPAVLGMNVCADGSVETKVYVQAADARALAAELAGRIRAFAEAAGREGADAGGVLSLDVEGDTLQPRAFFIALRDPVGEEAWRCVEALPGYDADAIAALIPFPPAPPRSIGLSLHDDVWTLYCKPRRSSRAPEALEPVAVFRADDVEIGVFVEPTEHAQRAFCRTDRYAISVRNRQGVPAPHAIESLMSWFASRLRRVEHESASITARLDDPPSPWRKVERGRS